MRKSTPIAHLPHVHRAVYFKTPAEHNSALLEGAIRCLSQYAERNRDPQTNEEADAVWFSTIALDNAGRALELLSQTHISEGKRK